MNPTIDPLDTACVAAGAALPAVDPAAPLLFLINAASGSHDAAQTQAMIASALADSGRAAELTFAEPGRLEALARDAAARARDLGSAVVAVGGDGTLSTIARAVHAAGCPMGVVAQGTFNMFARNHGLPTDPAQAVALLADAVVSPVQVAAVNDHLFLVNASLGLYPDLLEDREAFKQRFGRSRLVAIGAAFSTLLRAQAPLRLEVECAGETRQVRALTLFVGNNRLQLERLGLVCESQVDSPQPASSPAGPGSLTAVLLSPVGTAQMLRLMFRGALGTLGEGEGVHSFAFTRMRVQPPRMRARRAVKVAFDGEIAWLRAPLEFRLLSKPLYLLDRRAVPAEDPPPALRR